MGNIADSVPLEDGIYPCFWGGYEVWLDVIGVVGVGECKLGERHLRPFTLRLRSLVGIRTMRAEAFLTVVGGAGNVKAQERTNG